MLFSHKYRRKTFIYFFHFLLATDPQTSIDEMKAQHKGLTREIGQVKLILDQLRFQRDESQSYIPNIKAPVKIIKDADPFWDNDDGITELGHDSLTPSACSMESCFDFSRCSLVSGFPVYFYDPTVHSLTSTWESDGQFDSETVLSSVRQFFDRSVYRTREPEKACVFVVLLGWGISSESDSTLFSQSPFSPRKIEQFLYDLPHWAGDGRNHVLLHLAQTDSFDPLTGVNTGRALVAKAIFSNTSFRDGFDVVIPPNIGPVSGEHLWRDLPPLSPIRRKLLLSFWGQSTLPPSSPSDNSRHQEKHDIFRDKNAYVNKKHKRHHRRPLAILHNPHIPPSLHSSEHKKGPFNFLEQAIVSSLGAFSNSAQGEVLVDTLCSGEKILHASITNSSWSLEDAPPKSTPFDWALCGSERARADILRHSTFSLVLAPLNSTLDSTLAFQTRLLESLLHGSIPLVVGSSFKWRSLLPFAERLRWESAAVVLPVPRITEVPFYLQSYPDEDIAALRLQGREFYQKFLGSTNAILEVRTIVN